MADGEIEVTDFIRNTEDRLAAIEGMLDNYHNTSEAIRIGC